MHFIIVNIGQVYFRLKENNIVDFLEMLRQTQFEYDFFNEYILIDDGTSRSDNTTAAMAGQLSGIPRSYASRKKDRLAEIWQPALKR